MNKLYQYGAQFYAGFSVFNLRLQADFAKQKQLLVALNIDFLLKSF